MRQLRVTAVPLALILVLTAACSKDGGESGNRAPPEQVTMASAPSASPRAMQSASVMMQPMSRPAAAGAADVPDAAARMLIRRATASVEVARLDEAMNAARSAAARNGGVVANAQVETGRNAVHRGMLQIRVPAERFDALLAGLAPLGRVESVHVTAQDVGEEYVDVEARIVNLHRLEARMIDLLASRTGKLEEVLSVERELARVRGEIEQMEGRRRYLKVSVALSTLELTLHEPDPIIAGSPGSNPIVTALRDGWRYSVATVAWGITALGVVVPVAIFILGAVLLTNWIRRHFPVARPRPAADIRSGQGGVPSA